MLWGGQGIHLGSQGMLSGDPGVLLGRPGIYFFYSCQLPKDQFKT